MAPVLPTTHVSALEPALSLLPHGKTLNPPVALAALPKREMVQYRCNVKVTDVPGRPDIYCEPVVRFYREMTDGRLVETTSWEKLQGGKKTGGSEL